MCKEGFTINDIDIGGDCGALETAECVVDAETGVAGFQYEFYYKQCCSDKSGIERSDMF